MSKLGYSFIMWPRDVLALHYDIRLHLLQCCTINSSSSIDYQVSDPFFNLVYCHSASISRQLSLHVLRCSSPNLLNKTGISITTKVIILLLTNFT